MHAHHGGASFDSVLAALRRPTVVTTLVTRSNFRSLALIPPILLKHSVPAWRLALPVVAGRNVDALTARLALAAPRTLHALVGAEAGGLFVGIQGFPACVLGPYADRLVGPAGVFSEVCAQCLARKDCRGISQEYYQRFGADELRRRGSVTSVRRLPILANLPAPFHPIRNDAGS